MIVAERVAGAEAERQRIRGAVGVPADRHPLAIDVAAVVGVLERRTDELDVWAVAGEQQVPRRLVARIGRQDDDAEFVGEREGVGDAASGVAGAVQHHHQRPRLVRRVAARDVDHTVAVRLAQLEIVLSGPDREVLRAHQRRQAGRHGGAAGEKLAAVHVDIIYVVIRDRRRAGCRVRGPDG